MTQKSPSDMTIAELEAAMDAIIEAGGPTGKGDFIVLRYWYTLLRRETPDPGEYGYEEPDC